MRKKKTVKTDEKETLQSLVAKTDVENPSPKDLEKLKRFIESDKAFLEANEISRIAFSEIAKVYSRSPTTGILRELELEERRREFGYHNSDLLIRMMIDEVILSHMRLMAFEVYHAKSFNKPHSIEEGEYRDRMLGSHQRRFLAACNSLAKVKRIYGEMMLKHAEIKAKEGN